VRVEVEIEEFVLHGFPPLDHNAVAEAARRELAQLVVAAPPPDRGAAALDAGSFAAPEGPDARELGARIASRLGEVLR
jgi:hypothetical protein